MRANYNNLKKGIYETTEYLERFLKNLLLHQKNKLSNRNLHIYAGADEEKPDIGEEKPDIGEEKPDIDIAEQFKIAADSFSGKTISHMQKLFANYGAGIIFGRSDVMDLLGIKKSGASELLRKMLKAGMLEAVSGHGKGRYRFKNP